MQALTIQDILPIAEFTAQRRQIQGQLKQVRAPRRVALGPNFMFFFENRATLQWQIQEMCRVETITDDVGVQHELDTYNALLPTADSLSATLLLAWDEVEVRDADGQPLPSGTPGEVCVRSPSQTLGYFRNPARTAELGRALTAAAECAAP